MNGAIVSKIKQKNFQDGIETRHAPIQSDTKEVLDKVFLTMQSDQNKCKPRDTTPILTLNFWQPLNENSTVNTKTRNFFRTTLFASHLYQLKHH